MSESAEGLGDSVRAHRGLGGLLRNPFTAGGILAVVLFLVVYWAMGLADVGGWRGVIRLGLGAWVVSAGFLYLHYHILRRDAEEARERDGFRQLTNNVLRPGVTSALAQRVTPEFARPQFAQRPSPARPQFAQPAPARPQFAQPAPARPQFAQSPSPARPQFAQSPSPARPQFAQSPSPARPQFAQSPSPARPQFAQSPSPARPQFAQSPSPARPQFAQPAPAAGPPAPQKIGGAPREASGVSWADSAGYTPIAPMP